MWVSTSCCALMVGVPGPALPEGVSPIRLAITGTPSAATAATVAARPAIASVRRRRRRTTSRVNAADSVAGNGGSGSGLIENGRIHPVEQTGQAGQGANRPRALVAVREVPLEGQSVARTEGAEHVGPVLVGELAAHALTPISSRASLRARRA